MTAVTFILSANIQIVSALWGQPTWQWSTLLFSLGLGLLNRFAGWCVLDKSLLWYRLAIINLGAQTVAFNLPFAQYGYKGILYVYVASSEMFTQPLDLKFGYTIDFSTFSASKHLVANFPTMGVNLFALFLVVMLLREYRVVRKITE